MTEPVTQPALEEMAREVGASGADYETWTWRVSDLVLPDDLDTDAAENAYCEGRRTYRMSHGWVERWTTAPEAYDTYGTEQIEAAGEWRGKPLRRVLIDGCALTSQTDRYASGLHGAWEVDPRVEEQRLRDEDAKVREGVDRLNRIREEGLAWLPTAAEADLNDVDLLWARGLDRSDARAEKERRAAIVAKRERDAVWERCRAAFTDGATLIDDGTEGFRGAHGWIQGQPPDAWRMIHAEPHYADPRDAEQARVIGEGSRFVGSLREVADRIASGRYRVARPDEAVPPRAVVARLGCEYTKIRAADVEGRRVWVGRPLFAYDPLVLDDAGHLIRSKRVRETALGHSTEQSKKPTSI